MLMTMRGSEPDARHDEHFAGDLFGELQLAQDEVHGGPWARAADLVPGLAACGTAAAAAAWLASRYGFPLILLGLLVGSSLTFISSVERAQPGLRFASTRLLQWAIVLLGFQVSLHQVTALGPMPFLAVTLVAGVTIIAGMVAARLVGIHPNAGLLAGGATAICGASAAFALHNVLKDGREDEGAQFTVTLAGISIASAAAMSLYPLLAREIGLNDRQAGFLIGASIHDVAQAIGGGYAYSNAAGSYATIIKLTRVALLVPVVMVVSSLKGPANAGRRRLSRPRVPPFLLAFAAIVALSGLVAIPAAAAEGALTVSKVLLLVAVTSTAMRTRLDVLASVGWRSVFPVVMATVTSFVMATIIARSAGF